MRGGNVLARSMETSTQTADQVGYLDSQCEVPTFLPGRWEHLPRPQIRSKRVVAAKRASSEILARVCLRFGGARGGGPQIAEFQAQGLPGDPQ